MGEIPLVGTKIRGWRLVRLLGVGPVSAAYEVYYGDDAAGEHAVLKLCTIQEKDAQNLFLRAVYAANRFRHPRVVPILQDGTDETGAPFVIRPWLDARSLAETVAERDMTEKEVLRMAEQLLDALEMAHAHGITHGALTPHNLLLTPKGSIRLCDFAMTPSVGVDRPSNRASHADVRDRVSEMRAGPYTAPERTSWPGARATEPGDVWSVGACMYFALCKRSPKGERTSANLLKELPSLSKGTLAILNHALNPDPGARYESAYAMLGDVRRAMSGRRPKLSFAEKPIPSGGYRSSSLHTPPLGEPVGAALTRIGRPSMTEIEVRAEWRGNAALILAIVALVGVATAVMVHEKLTDTPTKSDEPR